MRILDDIIENVSTSAPALLPLFRSDQQLRLVNVWPRTNDRVGTSSP